MNDHLSRVTALSDACKARSDRVDANLQQAGVLLDEARQAAVTRNSLPRLAFRARRETRVRERVMLAECRPLLAENARLQAENAADIAVIDSLIRDFMED